MDARVELIEAAYRLDLTELAQLDLLVEVLRRRYEPRRQLLAFTSHFPGGTPQCRSVTATDRDIRPLFAVPVFGEDVDRMQFTAPARVSLTALLSGAYCGALADNGVGEIVGLNCPTHTGSAIVLGAIDAGPCQVDFSERRYWDPVARHLAAGLRLRENVNAPVDAVFRVDRGRCEPTYVAGAARNPTARDALRRAVVTRERVRVHSRATDGELWRELVHGRWTLIDRFEEGGRRHVLAVCNPPGAAIRALAARERSVIDAVARGESNKAIAIDVGVSEATISRMLRTALAKLGVGLAELIALPAASATVLQLGRTRLGLFSAPGEHLRIRDLSAGERATVAAALRGLPNSVIARSRQVAIRTVVNQLASAYRKLGVRSRRELILALAR